MFEATRRTFLGILGAVSVSPDMSEEDSTVLEDSHADGSNRTEIPDREPVWGMVDASSHTDESVNIDLAAYSYDDEPGAVRADMWINSANVYFEMSPDRARQLAEDLEAAADQAAKAPGDGQ